MHRFQRQVPFGSYEDIYDGEIYRTHYQNDGFLSKPTNLSFTFNTDGAAVFKSSKVSVWPLFLVINELPYKLRMKKENMILASLWFGTKKPTMSTFMQPFLETFNEIDDGFKCFSPNIGNFICKGMFNCYCVELQICQLEVYSVIISSTTELFRAGNVNKKENLLKLGRDILVFFRVMSLTQRDEKGLKQL